MNLKTDPQKLIETNIRKCDLACVRLAASSTLIGMRQGTFHPLSILDQTLLAEFLPKIPKFFGSEN